MIWNNNSEIRYKLYSHNKKGLIYSLTVPVGSQLVVATGFAYCLCDSSTHSSLGIVFSD